MFSSACSTSASIARSRDMDPSVSATLGGVIVQRGRRRASATGEQDLGQLECGQQIRPQTLELHRLRAFLGVLLDRGLDGGKRVPQVAATPEEVEVGGGVVRGHARALPRVT